MQTERILIVKDFAVDTQFKQLRKRSLKSGFITRDLCDLAKFEANFLTRLIENFAIYKFKKIAKCRQNYNEFCIKSLIF